MEYLRLLDQNEQNLLNEVLKETKDQLLNSRGNEVYWLNLYLNRKHVIDFVSSHILYEWVKNLIIRVYSDQHQILSYGWIVNPAHSKVDQKFHYDYTSTS